MGAGEESLNMQYVFPSVYPQTNGFVVKTRRNRAHGIRERTLQRESEEHARFTLSKTFDFIRPPTREGGWARGRGEEKKPSNGFDVPPAASSSGWWFMGRGRRESSMKLCVHDNYRKNTIPYYIIVLINVFSIILFITRRIIDTFFSNTLTS